MAKLIQSIRTSKLAPFIPTYSFQECGVHIDPRHLRESVEQTLRNIWTQLDLIDGACFIAGGIIERLFAFYNAPHGKVAHFSNDIDVFCFADPRIREVIVNTVEKNMYMTENAITLEVNLCIDKPTKIQFEKVQFIPLPALEGLPSSEYYALPPSTTSPSTTEAATPPSTTEATTSSTKTGMAFVEKVDNFIERFDIDCCAMWYDRQTGLHIHPRAERALIEKANVFRPIGSNAGSRALKYLERGYDIILPELTDDQLQSRLDSALHCIVDDIFGVDRTGLGSGNLRGLLRRVLKVVDAELVALSYSPYTSSMKPFHFSTKLCQAIDRSGSVHSPTERLEWMERVVIESRECFGRDRSITSIMESLVSIAEGLVEKIIARGFYRDAEDFFLRALRQRIDTFRIYGLRDLGEAKSRLDKALGRIVHLLSETTQETRMPPSAAHPVDTTEDDTSKDSTKGDSTKVEEQSTEEQQVVREGDPIEEGFVATGYNEAMTRGPFTDEDFIREHAGPKHHVLRIGERFVSMLPNFEAINEFLDGRIGEASIKLIHRSILDHLSLHYSSFDRVELGSSMRKELKAHIDTFIDKKIRELGVTTDLRWMSLEEMFARKRPVFDRTSLEHWYDE